MGISCRGSVVRGSVVWSLVLSVTSFLLQSIVMSSKINIRKRCSREGCFCIVLLLLYRKSAHSALVEFSDVCFQFRAGLSAKLAVALHCPAQPILPTARLDTYIDTTRQLSIKIAFFGFRRPSRS